MREEAFSGVHTPLPLDVTAATAIAWPSLVSY